VYVLIHSVWRALSCMYSQCVEGALLYVFTVCGGRASVYINSVSKGALLCVHSVWKVLFCM
jgi:hypothetical protein